MNDITMAYKNFNRLDSVHCHDIHKSNLTSSHTISSSYHYTAVHWISSPFEEKDLLFCIIVCVMDKMSQHVTEDGRYVEI